MINIQGTNAGTIIANNTGKHRIYICMYPLQYHAADNWHFNTNAVYMILSLPRITIKVDALRVNCSSEQSFDPESYSPVSLYICLYIIFARGKKKSPVNFANNAWNYDSFKFSLRIFNWLSNYNFSSKLFTCIWYFQENTDTDKFILYFMNKIYIFQ